MEQLSLSAPAKINLQLRITGRREDGYHTLATLMQKVSLADRLHLRLQEEGITLACPDSALPSGPDNLAHRAAVLFGSALAGKRCGVAMVLEKRIPVAAGLGGGSSDAAAVLLGLNRLHGEVLSPGELAQLALALGADVPFLVHPAPAAWATGIGEQLTPVPPLAGWHVLLVTPEIAVSTKWAFETFALTADADACRLSGSQKVEAETCPCLDRPLEPTELVNDLEPVTSGRHPVIQSIRQDMCRCGAAAAMMSGSGPTVFGLFAEPSRAEQCARQLRKQYRQVHLAQPLSGSHAAS
jgi:4-diphosphocytidyl-2-C-methyl-D-erythritol kinase